MAKESDAFQSPPGATPGKAEGRVRILIVDDHKIVRDGLRLALGAQADLNVVGEAGDRKTALAKIEESRPELVIIDIGLPDADGVDLAAEVLETWPDLQVIILSGVADPEHLDRALAVGVSGYLLKLNAAADLIAAIRAVRRNEVYLSPEVSSVLVTGYQRLRETRAANQEVELTERERQVLKRIAEGRNTKEIAAELSLSVKTIETYRTRLMHKLALHTVAELTKYAIRMGYTSV
jgi:DNA-binding NarL/FixJ family response regulator